MDGFGNDANSERSLDPSPPALKPMKAPSYQVRTAPGASMRLITRQARLSLRSADFNYRCAAS